MTRAHMMTGGRYPVLRAIGILYVFLAAATIIAGIIGIGWSLFFAPAAIGERFALAGGALLATFVGVVTMLAVAEFIKLMIDIEHNTRAAATRGPATLATDGTTTVIATSGDGHTNRLTQLDEESAEAALLRGH